MNATNNWPTKMDKKLKDIGLIQGNYGIRIMIKDGVKKMDKMREEVNPKIEKEKETKKEYNKEFEIYLKSELNQDEIIHDKESFTKLVRKAKEGWDLYTENECLAEAANYEKDNDGYNATYNICLIGKNIQRIKYYKENKH